jgi:hypothetical protein
MGDCDIAFQKHTSKAINSTYSHSSSKARRGNQCSISEEMELELDYRQSVSHADFGE